VLDGVVYYKDKDLKKRWHCSGMKLWRMRKDGKLNSIQLGGCGPYLTSDAEIARIEAPPDIVKPAASPGRENDGRLGKSVKHPLDSQSATESQAFPSVASMNGGAHG
jgi:hypothetical protein